MKKTALPFPDNRRTHTTSCIDQVVGDILSGWRYDISGLSPAMRTDYDQHLSDCGHCRHRQRIARTIDVLLISVSTLSIVAFALAAVVIHRLELITHISTLHVHLNQTHAVAISLEAAAVLGALFSTLLWVLVAVATPLPGFLGGIVQERIPADLRERFGKDAA
ncbi:hypothetical protein [Granulicella sp. L60]|jgi:hypothetical protein|uniref:hypothetical protein n=1 Tax=Granulicella sp. L60 TaxID=1641866 RepID=UPI00131E6ECD|nr:hypothetical protein [Granulicella sp. L60]